MDRSILRVFANPSCELCVRGSLLVSDACTLDQDVPDGA
jgi:hypothetical protein